MTPSVDSRTHASLLGRLGANPSDAAAWNEFLRRYGDKIRHWCRHWRLQEADAQDVTQNVLLIVGQRMQRFQYDPARSFRAWLKSIARGAWLDWLEAQRRAGQGTGDSKVLDLLSSAEAGDDLVRKLEEEYECELLEAASVRVRLRVEPRTWQAFHLLVYEGLSGKDVAAQLGMNVGAVFVAKSKVQKMLTAVIAELENGLDHERVPVPRTTGPAPE